MDKYKKFILAKCDEALGKTVVMEKFYKWFLDQKKTQNFNPHDSGNAVVMYEKNWEEMLASMEDNGVKEARRMTEFVFYCRVQYFEKKVKRYASQSK